jgi:hypothetical protein
MSSTPQRKGPPHVSTPPSSTSSEHLEHQVFRFFEIVIGMGVVQELNQTSELMELNPKETLCEVDDPYG